MDLYEWKTKNGNARKYAHVDDKVSLDKVWDYISDPTNIVKHGFYPFIHYEKKFNKITYIRIITTNVLQGVVFADSKSNSTTS